MLAISKPVEQLKLKDLAKARSFIYLPEEGLQGENIPSHILWENVKAENIQIAFRPPLKFKEIFNVESYDIQDNNIIVKKVELEGYVGLSFESSKITDLEKFASVKYLMRLSNGEVVKEEKKIRLFRPQLHVNVKTKEIAIDPKTGFIKGRMGIKNIGRGTLIMNISGAEGSPTQLETPPEHLEFAEKFNSDLFEEMSKLSEEFPNFQSVYNEMFEWEKKNPLELSEEERDEFLEYVNRVANVLAGDKDLLLRFIEAYAKALARNAELIEAVGKFIRVYESFVSKDILLINPFDEVVLTEEKNEMMLKIKQTDRVYDKYDDITLPKIELVSPKPARVPIYKLFDWG